MLRLWRRFRYLIRQRRTENELAEEMEFHRSMEQQRLARNGVDDREAALASRRLLWTVLKESLAVAAFGIAICPLRLSSGALRDGSSFKSPRSIQCPCSVRASLCSRWQHAPA